MRTPGEEIEQIRSHNPNPYEVWFLFLGTGVALGGFLWLMSVRPERREVFAWLDFITITGFMTACMLLFAVVPGFTTWLAAWLSGKKGGY